MGRRKNEMALVLIALQLITLLAIIVLLFRKPHMPEQDSRLAQLPDQLIRLDDRIREALVQIPKDIANEGRLAREDGTAAAGSLRQEVIGNITTLGQTLGTSLNSFRDDNKTSNDQLRNAVQTQMDTITRRISDFTNDTSEKHTNLREALNTKLNEMIASNTNHQNQLRTTVEERLNQINQANADKLEQMRATVDEKLQSTLQTRLTESFGQVTTHLGEVQRGLGEMKQLATGVGDLKKVLSNVARRGGVGQFMVEQQLEQMFSPEQYLKQVNIKPDTTERVDFALKFPNGENGSFVLLPIDAKFPTSDWERLDHAYEHGTSIEIAAAGKAFERAIREEAKSISDKYIDPPTTMPHAIMCLPTENLYAEVVRRPGLQSEIQSSYRVTIAGPSTFMAILTSFQMGFHTLAIQKKGDEVWRVLSSAKYEFEKFGGLMDKVKKQVGTVQKTLGKISGKTKTINKTLKDVGRIEDKVSPDNPSFEELAAITPLLAASADEE